MKRSLLGISMGTTTEEELLVVVLARALCVLGLIATGSHAGAPCVRCLCLVRQRCQRCHVRHTCDSCLCPSTCLLSLMGGWLLLWLLFRS